MYFKDTIFLNSEKKNIFLQKKNKKSNFAIGQA